MPLDPFARTYAGWAEAFSIFARYPDDEPGVAVERDKILAGPDPNIVSLPDLARLLALGWYSDDTLECFYRLV